MFGATSDDMKPELSYGNGKGKKEQGVEVTRHSWPVVDIGGEVSVANKTNTHLDHHQTRNTPRTSNYCKHIDESVWSTQSLASLARLVICNSS